MKMILEKENFLKSTIRDIVAINPFVSIRRMQEMMEENTGRSISDKYVAKLMNKVRREAVLQSDRKKLNERLAEVRERYRVLMEDLCRSIYWKPEFLVVYGIQCPNYKERLQAIKLLARLETELFRAELHAGMFEDRRVSLEEIPRRGLLQGEIRAEYLL